MRLSFVIPTKNQSRYIGECIESCLVQAVPSSEIIVVDGASTDDTLAVVSRFGDRIRVYSEPDRGQSDAVNKGVALASGEIIAWINSDDFYAHREALRPLLSALDAEPSLDIVYGDGLRVAKDGRSIGPYRARAITGVRDLVTNPASIVLQPALLFRRQLFLDIGGLDENLHYTMDYDLWMRLFAAARATRYVPAVIACARYHEDAKSVAGMGSQIVEAYGVKMRAAKKASLGSGGYLKLHVGMVALGVYFLVARIKAARSS